MKPTQILSAPSSTQNGNINEVYATSTGKKFRRRNCQHLSKSQKIQHLNRQEAEAKGLTP